MADEVAPKVFPEVERAGTPTQKAAAVSATGQKVNSPQGPNPGSKRASPKSDVKKESSGRSSPHTRPKCGDPKCRCAASGSPSHACKSHSKALVKAVTASNGKVTRMVCDPEEIQELEAAEKKKGAAAAERKTESSSSSTLAKKTKQGGKSKKAATKVPELDTETLTLSQINANVNNLFQEQLRALLSSLQLDERGMKEVLRKRIKNHYRKNAIATGTLARMQETFLDYYCVMDIEATCEKEARDGYIHEPIEIPIAIINSFTRKVEFRFHAYCKPTLQPTLSDFCTELTGIKQESVDTADTFDVVLPRLVAWVEEKLKGKTFAFVTDGDADIRNFLVPACERASLDVPAFWYQWINMRNAFANFYRLNMSKLDLPGAQGNKIKGMLQVVGVPHQGHLHSGRDDAENIARVIQVMLRDGCCLRVNKGLDSVPGCSLSDTASNASRSSVASSGSDSRSSASKDIAGKPMAVASSAAASSSSTATTAREQPSADSNGHGTAPLSYAEATDSGASSRSESPSLPANHEDDTEETAAAPPSSYAKALSDKSRSSSPSPAPTPRSDSPPDQAVTATPTASTNSNGSRTSSNKKPSQSAAKSGQTSASASPQLKNHPARRQQQKPSGSASPRQSPSNSPSLKGKNGTPKSRAHRQASTDSNWRSPSQGNSPVTATKKSAPSNRSSPHSSPATKKQPATAVPPAGQSPQATVPVAMDSGCCVAPCSGGAVTPSPLCNGETANRKQQVGNVRVSTESSIECDESPCSPGTVNTKTVSDNSRTTVSDEAQTTAPPSETNNTVSTTNATDPENSNGVTSVCNAVQEVSLAEAKDSTSAIAVADEASSLKDVTNTVVEASSTPTREQRKFLPSVEDAPKVEDSAAVQMSTITA